MAPYTPNNLYVFCAAMVGAHSGLLANSSPLSTSPTYSGYVDTNPIAAAFAQAVDTAWDSASNPSVYQKDEIEESSTLYFSKFNPGSAPASADPASYTTLAAEILALVQSGVNELSSIGISSPAIGQGGFNNSWLQSDWYLDWVNGSDANPGSLTLPVKTYTNGIRPKWGTDTPTLPQTTKFHVVSPQPVGAEHATPAPLMVATAGVPSNFIILGTLAPVGATFVAGVVTAKVIGSPGQLLTMATMPARATAGQLIQRVSDGSLAVIDSILDGVASISQPYTLASFTSVVAVFTVTNASKVDTWATGQTFQLLQPPTFNFTQAFLYGGDSNLAFTAPVGWTQWINIPDASGTAGTSTFTAKPQGPGMTFSGCTFQAFPWLDGSETVFGLSAFGCWSPGGVTNIEGFWYGGASNVNLSFETVSVRGTFDGGAILHGNVEMQGVYNILGEVYIDSRLALIHGAIVFMNLGTADHVAHPGGVVWGPGGIDQEGPNSGLEIVNAASGATFTNTLIVNSVTLNANVTATKYVPGAPGVWTDGIALNVTTLDANGGLQAPLTGCRYVQTATAS